MTASTRTIARRLIPGVILGFVVILALALLGDLREVSRTLLQFRWEYYLIALGLTLINYTLRFFKWHFYLGQIGVHKPAWFQSLRMFVSGFPLAVTPGKVGEVLKGVWINRIYHVPVGRGVSVVVAERISDGLAVMILSMLGIFAYPQYWLAFAIILALLISVVVLSQIRPVALFILRQGERLPLVNKIAHTLREFYEGSFALFRPGATFIAVGLGTISWLAEGMGLYFILIGLGMEPGFQLMVSSIFILSFSTAVGAASAMPAGLGAAEISIAGMLTLLSGANPAVVSSATLLIRLATLWFGVALGLITWTFSADLLGLQTEREFASEV